MASITISRGTPFSAASWVMAVTNSLFMSGMPSALSINAFKMKNHWPLALGLQQKKWGRPTSKRSVRRRLRLAVPSVSISQECGQFRRVLSSRSGSPREAATASGPFGVEKTLRRVDPLIVAFDELYQALVGLGLGN